MPDHVPTDATRTKVRALSGYGMDVSGIATLLGIDAAAVRACYGTELRVGPIEAEAAVRQALHRKALAGDRMALRMLRRA